MAKNTEQKHPQEKGDREVLAQIVQGECDDLNMVELARLKIRYKGFPGTYDLQQKLEDILQKWGLTEEELFAKTREIHADGKVYKHLVKNQEDKEDWS